MCTSASRAAEGKQPRIEKAGAIEVTMSDGTRMRYMQNAGGVYDDLNRGVFQGTHYLPSEIDSLKTLYSRLQKSEGVSVKVLSGKEVSRQEKEASERWRNSGDYETGTGLSDNREHRKKARQQHLETRLQRKHRRG